MKRPSELRAERRKANKRARAEARGPRGVPAVELVEPHPPMASQSRPTSGALDPRKHALAYLKRSHADRVAKQKARARRS